MEGTDDDSDVYSVVPLEHPMLRYLGHGFFFSILGFALAFILVPLLVFLILIGYVIGLIIGILIAFFMYGAINSYLMDKIWDTQMNWSWKALLPHGFVLWLALLVVGIPWWIIEYFSADQPLTAIVPIAIIFFIIYCFVDGYIGKSIGSHWEGEDILEDTREDVYRVSD